MLDTRTVVTPLLVPAATRLGAIHLSVTDADRALAIWRDVVGLTVIDQTPGTIVLGAGGKPLVHLHPGAARPVVPETAGLYHVAIHVPTRAELAKVLARGLAAKVRVSPTDHLVSEALYLWDFDGNGIEITFETPWRGRFVEDEVLRAETPDGRSHSGREPIDVPGLLAEIEGGFATPLPAGTRIGHVHLHVGDLDRAMAFYRDGLGFAGQLLARRHGMADVTMGYAPHILAFNIWAGGSDLDQPPAGSAGLRHYEIVLPDAEALSQMAARLRSVGAPVRETENGIETADPYGNRVLIGDESRLIAE